MFRRLETGPDGLPVQCPRSLGRAKTESMSGMRSREMPVPRISHVVVWRAGRRQRRRHWHATAGRRQTAAPTRGWSGSTGLGRLDEFDQNKPASRVDEIDAGWPCPAWARRKTGERPSARSRADGVSRSLTR